jgi:3-hydroxyanthranilate 3,4-dioxygenase
MIPAAFNLDQWIDEHRALLKPPVGNKCIVADDFIVMIVGGPNARTDYHHDEGAEFFHQIEGEMVLKIQENGRVREIPIRAGEIFYLPPRVPHSPQRSPGSIGLVIERCNHKLYEEFFKLRDIETDFPRVFEHFHRSPDARTCTACGHENPAPDADRS